MIKIQKIDINDLNFDRENPRLVEFGLNRNSTEDDMIKILAEVMSVNEIILSIVNSGFFENESLIAVREDSKYIVIEGNRRLATVKIVCNYTNVSSP